MKKIILFCISLISVFWFMSSGFIQSVFADPLSAREAEARRAGEAEREAIAKEAARTEACATSKDCIDKPTFTIDTSDFSIWWTNLKDESGSAEKTINKTFWVFIKKMMIWLIMLSSFVMTVWAWYMILYFGQDEYLTRWKTIFKMWLVSIIIALSSYYMVNLVTYILYK